MPQQPATGAAALWGWRRERLYNIPGTGDYVFLRPMPPLTAGLQRAESPSGEINASGFRQPGVPAGITGPLDLGVALSAATILEPLENILGAVVDSTLEAGVFQYVFTPDRTPAVEPSLEAIYCEPPVDRRSFYGIKL